MSSISVSSRRAPSRLERRASAARHRPSRRTRCIERKHRHRSTHKARLAARKLRRLHRVLPTPARSLFDAFRDAFSFPTFLRFFVLALASILTVGSRTVSNLLRTLGTLAPGHPSSYHRVFCQRRWSCWRVAHALANWVFAHLLPEGTVLLAGDDTVDEHPGDKVFGKGCHRDAVRSSHGYTAYRWGHKWVVLAVLVRFPFTRRRWALPLLVALYRNPVKKNTSKAKKPMAKNGPRHKQKNARKVKKTAPKNAPRHKTPAQLLRQLCCVLVRWFPQRRFLLSGDGGFGSHEMARFAARLGRADRLHLVSRFYPDARLYQSPPPYAGKGRPRVKGDKLPTPQQVVATAPRQPLQVNWYGGGRRDVEVVTATAPWYKSGQGLVAVRWVFVHDKTGTHRDEYFFTTAVALSAKEVIETYVSRWNEETTFQEMRAHLGLETTRGWKAKTVLRAAPCLFGLYTVVVGLYSQLPQRYQRVRGVDWVGKQDRTFSDAITAVRQYLWREWVFAIPGYKSVFQKLSRSFGRLLVHALTPAI